MIKHFFKLIIYITILIEINASDIPSISVYKITGVVEKESFTYLNFTHKGHVFIHLETIEGDTDLYIREDNKAPGVDPNEYDLQSVTCGADFVEFSDSLKRPVIIGVYGHPSHENSTYNLSIYIDSAYTNHELFDNEEIDNQQFFEKKKPRKNENESKEEILGFKKYKVKASFLTFLIVAFDYFCNLF